MSSFNIHELFHACEIGDRKKVETFLDTTKADVDTPDAEDLTALQVAAANDQVHSSS
jgi:ankyrin repeat protein